MLMLFVLDNYSARRNEKRKNKMIQKKSIINKNEVLPQNSNKLLSEVDKDGLENNETPGTLYSESKHSTISIVIDHDKDLERDDNKLNITSPLSPSKELKQDKFDTCVINFINEENITFFENEDLVLNNESYTKIENSYFNLIFKEYCQVNKIKLTKKELLIDCFMIDNNLKEYFRKLYNIFIDPNGISPLNISNSVLEDVNKALKQDTFSHKIFKKVILLCILYIYCKLYLTYNNIRIIVTVYLLLII